MDIEKTRFGDVAMMDGESVDCALNLRDGLVENPSEGGDLILLTDRRVIHLSANGKDRKVVYVPLQEVSAAEVATESSGFGGYIWGGLAFVIAALIWRVWDNPFWSVAAAVGLVLMGVYLILDQVYSPQGVRAVFRAGTSEIKCDVGSANASKDLHTFVNRLFQLKGDGTQGERKDGAAPGRTFAPR